MRSIMPANKWVLLGIIIFISIAVRLLRKTIIGHILGAFLYIIAFFVCVIVGFLLLDFII